MIYIAFKTLPHNILLGPSISEVWWGFNSANMLYLFCPWIFEHFLIAYYRLKDISNKEGMKMSSVALTSLAEYTGELNLFYCLLSFLITCLEFKVLCLFSLAFLFSSVRTWYPLMLEYSSIPQQEEWNPQYGKNLMWSCSSKVVNLNWGAMVKTEYLAVLFFQK